MNIHKNVYLYGHLDVHFNVHLNNHLNLHMAGASQPQHFFAAGCLFADFAIPVIFYPVIKTL